MSMLDDHANGRRWPMTLLRLSLVLTSALLFGQAVLAGLFMGGVRLAFDLHREMATVAGIVLMVAIIAAILAGALSRAPRWPIVATVGLLALMSLQAFAGFRSLVAMHVPLGVLVITLSVALTVWTSRWHSPGARGSGAKRTFAERPADEPEAVNSLEPDHRQASGHGGGVRRER